MTHVPTPYETFVVRSPGGGVPWAGEVYRTDTYRRRVVVRAPDGLVVFDSRDCRNLGNARAALECWLTRVVAWCRPDAVDLGAAVEPSEADTAVLPVVPIVRADPDPADADERAAV